MRSLVVCTTCKFAPESKLAPNGRTGGETMLAALQEALQAAGRSDIVIESHACLWNCTRFCSIVMRDDERFSYVTGGHEPTLPQAKAVIAWFDLHGQSQTGEVPFRQWPDAMRGHFIARIPPVSA